MGSSTLTAASVTNGKGGVHEAGDVWHADPMTSLPLRWSISGSLLLLAVLAASPARAERVVTRAPFGVRDASLDATPTTGVQVAPGLYALRDGDLPFAVGCDTSADCPAVMLPARCVHLAPGVGACLYAETAFPDDPSCLGGGGAGCVERITGDYRAWATLDCDGDEIPNSRDWRVCADTRVVSASDGGRVTCERATLRPDPALCGPVAMTEVAPGTWFVCDPDATSAAFGICCHDVGDCPPVAAMTPTCVLFDDSMPDAVTGACTYRMAMAGSSPPGNDRSCVGLLSATGGILPDSCFASARSYSTWASGNCDLTCADATNAEDRSVCECDPPPLPDAGTGLIDTGIGEVDAGPVDAAAPDSGEVEPPDAATTADDAGAGVLDGGGPQAFSGAGCRCIVGRGDVASGRGASLLFLALAGLVVLRRAQRPRN
jgi:hypothetical protein